MEAIIDFLSNHEWVTKLLRIGIALLVLYVIKISGHKIISRIIRKTITPDKYSSASAEKMREDTLIDILSAILHMSIWVIGGMVILAQLNVNLAPLIAGASVAGLAIGFGSQMIVKDFVSGIFIILENQYRVGDWIAIGEINGEVEAITIRQTVLRDINGYKHFIPNGHGKSIANMTMDFSNLILHIEVSYEVDIKKVQRVIDQVCQKLSQETEFSSKIKECPAFQRIQAFGAHGVQVRIRGQVEPGQQWALAGELRLRIKEAFDKNKIAIPYPQLVLHQAKD